MQVTPHVLEDGDVSVTMLDYGVTMQDWLVPLNGGRQRVVLGFADAQDYPTRNRSYLGVVAGRVANRIAGARFTLDGETFELPANNGPNTLHGGPDGLSKQWWKIEPDGARAVRFTHRSPDGAMGFPGTVDFTITVRLDGTTLTYDMAARPDRPTPINLALHTYWNLMGTGPVWDHELQMQAGHYLPVDEGLIPTGEIASVDGTMFDFRKFRRLGDADPERIGSDINMVLAPGDGPQAAMRAPNGLLFRLWTDQPGIQFYTGANLNPMGGAFAGQTHDRFGGVCLEPQHFPDAVNQPGFASIIATPEKPYSQHLKIDISPSP